MSIKAFCVFLLAAALFAAVLHFGYPVRPEGDALYHFAHAEIYGENGIFDSSFPWLPYSAISKYGADIWYGFHILLIPFTWFSAPIFGIRLAGFFVTLTLLIVFYWALARLNAEKKYVWPFLLLLSGFFTLFHLTTLRPHVLSLAFGVLAYSFAVTGSFLGVFGASFAVGFFHLNLFWSTLLILGVLAVSKFALERSFDFRMLLSSIGGLLLGWLARPNPWGAAKLAYVQIVELMLAKSRGIPLNFGLELYPFGWAIFSQFWPFMVLWLLAVYVFLRRPKKDAVLWSGLALSAIFFLMTVFLAQRSFVLWAAFGVVFLAFIFAGEKRPPVLAAAAVLAIFMAGQSLYQNDRFLKTAGWSQERFRGAAEWLLDNSRAGEIVFNASWDYFPELFFWNRKNYYIGGMDPIFQYAYDPKLYWESYFLETGKTAEFTCPAVSCDEKTIKDTYAALKNDFNARYVFFVKNDLPAFYGYLSGNPNYSLKNEDENFALFELR